MLLKAEDKRKLAKRIGEHLQSNHEVRPFPATITRLLNALQDSTASNKTFESIIEQDPGLASKLLRLANSPLFCPSGRIESIVSAISLLGLRKLKSIAMSVAGDTMFSSGDAAAAARSRLWDHSVGVGTVGRVLARYLDGIDGDDMFLAGVFHDVGKLLFFDVMPELYEDMSRSAVGSALVGEEEYLTGHSHATVGFKSAQSWELPGPIQAAIGWHHNPGEATLYPEFVSAVALANCLARHWGVGCEPADVEDELEGLMASFALTDEQLAEAEAEAREAFDATHAG